MDVCPLTGQPCGNRRVVRITDVKKGRAVASLDLCETCAARFIQMDVSIITYLQQMMKQQAVAFVQLLFAQPVESVPPAQPTRACPKCGWTLDDISRKKKLGCGHCYSYFDATELLRQIHGADTHVGKRPQNLPKPPTAETLPEFTTKTVAEKVVESQRTLQYAVATEDYATAAKMRDLIRALAPVLELMEECEIKLGVLHGEGRIDEAGEIAKQILCLREDYLGILATYCG